jgi:dihydroorotate dehydrogenase
MKIITVWAKLKIWAWHKIVLFIPSEVAHTLFVWSISTPVIGPLSLWIYRCAVRSIPNNQKQFGSLRMDNLVGIAAGFDKNARCIQALHAMGFGFIEVGTVTPKPQKGNEKPRIKKLFSQKAIINAMGFNNDGCTIIKKRISELPVFLKQKLIVSISKNKDSLDWLLDIKLLMATFWFDCAAISVNLSSPNTPGLRNLQGPEQLAKIADLHKALCQQLGPHQLHPTATPEAKYPLLICKLSPDLSSNLLLECCEALIKHQYGAVILTNSTLNHNYTIGSHKGGLSGVPLTSKSNDVLKEAAKSLKGRVPIIGVGGIFTAEDAHKKLSLGADAIQLYTGFVFKGPKLIWDIREKTVGC